jgi:outer membrane protein assembly factor BamB
VSWTSAAAGAAIAGAPTSGGEVVYAGSRDHYVYALDLATGQRKWRTDVGGTALPSQPTGTDVVWAGSEDGTMYVIDYVTGKVAGRVPVGGPVGAAPLTVIGQVYLGTTKGGLYNVFEDLTNAPSVMWRFPANGAVTGTPVPVANGDLTFAATTQGTVYAVQAGSDLSGGTGTSQWTVQLGGPVRGGLAFHSNMLYAGCDDGYLYAIDTTDNTVSWKYPAGAAIRSPILVTGGLIYFGTLDRHVHALHATLPGE